MLSLLLAVQHPFECLLQCSFTNFNSLLKFNELCILLDVTALREVSRDLYSPFVQIPGIYCITQHNEDALDLHVILQNQCLPPLTATERRLAHYIFMRPGVICNAILMCRN